MPTRFASPEFTRSALLLNRANFYRGFPHLYAGHAVLFEIDQQVRAPLVRLVDILRYGF